jgi:hypothetical protein
LGHNYRRAAEAACAASRLRSIQFYHRSRAASGGERLLPTDTIDQGRDIAKAHQPAVAHSPAKIKGPRAPMSRFSMCSADGDGNAHVWATSGHAATLAAARSFSL